MGAFEREEDAIGIIQRIKGHSARNAVLDALTDGAASEVAAQPKPVSHDLLDPNAEPPTTGDE